MLSGRRLNMSPSFPTAKERHSPMMRLSNFLRDEVALIMTDWEEFAKINIPVAGSLSRAELRDHLGSILKFIADDMESAQTKQEQKEKSKGEGAKAGGEGESAAEIHADIRFMEGFDPLELMAEFRALRASITRLWDSRRSHTDTDYLEMVRFNESIDQVQMEGFARYIEKVNHARNLFLGTLVHDLRNPLGTVSLGAQLLKTTKLDDRQRMLAEQIDISATRTVTLVTHMIDDVRARLGKGLPISPHPMDMGIAVAASVSEAQLGNPRRAISVHTSGNLKGNWDGTRMSQVLSNLIGNAIQHGISSTTIEVAATGDRDGVTLSVFNDGQPIPAALLPTIFEPMTRAGNDQHTASASTSLGLGLFIVKEIVRAHGGDIRVVSTLEAGTTFTVRLPH